MTMNIVVGVDGSDTSYEALRWATHEARRRHAELRIVSCCTVPGYAGVDGAVYPNSVDFDMFKEGAAAVVSRAIALVGSIDNEVVVDGVTPMATPAAGIVGAAQTGDEIVIGATGHGGFLGALLGSVAAVVTHRAHVPVIVVPAKPDVPPMDSMNKIVVGVDGSPESLTALAWAYDEAALAGAELDVVHAWHYPYPVSEESPREVRKPMEADAARELEDSLASLAGSGRCGTVRVRSHLYEAAPVDALLEEGDDADLIVVGCRGRGGLRSRLLGSVSRTTVQHARCPVAVIREPS
jgi:nucleotide-binding universal stress UspA family protein